MCNCRTRVSFTLQGADILSTILGGGRPTSRTSWAVGDTPLFFLLHCNWGIWLDSQKSKGAGGHSCGRRGANYCCLIGIKVEWRQDKGSNSCKWDPDAVWLWFKTALLYTKNYHLGLEGFEVSWKTLIHSEDGEWKGEISPNDTQVWTSVDVMGIWCDVQILLKSKHTVLWYAMTV